MPAPMPRVATRPRGASSWRLAMALAAAILVVGCGVSNPLPSATPADFEGIVRDLARQGISVENVVSGDSGCTDESLSRTAIGFTASGLDQADAVRIHLFIFRNRAAYDRLRGTVDGCAKAFAPDAATFESVEASPFVAAGAGPWAPGFRAAIRTGIILAAGTGD